MNPHKRVRDIKSGRSGMPLRPRTEDEGKQIIEESPRGKADERIGGGGIKRAQTGEKK